MLGAVRLHADANHESGEYAILVRRDAQGTGLAFALMRLMIDWARAEGVDRIEGTVLARTERCWRCAAGSGSRRRLIGRMQA